MIARALAPLVAGYPVEVMRLVDGALAAPGACVASTLTPGPGLGLVQVGTWEEDEHHPGPVYLDLDPRRLRKGRLDVVFRQVHWSPIEALALVLRAWSAGSGSANHEASLSTLWSLGHHSPAVAIQLAAYRSVHPNDFLGGYSSPEVRALLDEAVVEDPLSAALHYQRYRRFGDSYEEVTTARMAKPLIHCHAWSRGDATAESIETVLGVSAAFQSAEFGDLAPLAQAYTFDARRAAVDAASDPELALRLAVDWAYDTDRTDDELDTLLRPLAARSSEPVWSRLCDFRS